MVNIEEDKRFFGSHHNMNKQKYYTLEELKVGMEVSIASLDIIYNTRILLDKESFVRDLDEE